jgi:hypothetical protein
VTHAAVVQKAASCHTCGSEGMSVPYIPGSHAMPHCR